MLQLREASFIREKIWIVQKNMSVMLTALGDICLANPVYAHGQLPSMVSL